MHNDPIVDETRKVRDELAAKFNYDVRAIGEHYRSLEISENRKVVLRAPRLISEEDETLVTNPA